MTSAVVTPTSDVNRDALVHVLAPVVTCVLYQYSGVLRSHAMQS